MEKFGSFDEIKKSLEKKETDCRAIVTHYLQNITTKAHLNAFVEVYKDSALAKADLIDEKISKGKAGKLAGMVIGIKDVLNYAGHESNASSAILKGYQAQFTTTAIQRLIAEDAIIIGRLNCDEFGMGSSCPIQGDSPEKSGLIPHGTLQGHPSSVKDSSVWDGHASD